MATLLMFSAPLGEAGVFETMCRVVSGVRVARVATLLMFLHEVGVLEIVYGVL